ncbi:hypothetical protein [Epilithonimonas mollis]|uniref:Uncharacterized protein n=1 Tax=Epilithonimonas mollis TaxID=216903 RepID=A0A1M6UW86_9FLAO|nr:hypothetical protein [Epilithonimonas mollis]SHK73459.1 hypothetical protein SAMN05444371_3493 [Epilithonimonas mollis]
MNLEILTKYINVFYATGLGLLLIAFISEYFSRKNQIRVNRFKEQFLNLEKQISSLNLKISQTNEINEILKKHISVNRRNIQNMEIKNTRLKNRVDYFKDQINNLKRQCKNSNIR